MKKFPVLLALFSIAVAVAEERPLNLLIIQTDEHHFGTLGCYGGTIVGTPNTDRIANEGAMCTSFYATTPVCSPSRAALVSGLFPQKTPVVTNNIPLDDNIVTFAEVLRRNGYATGFAGKWHLDGSKKPQWAPERKFGFDDNRFMFNRGHWKKFAITEDGPQIAARDKNNKPSYNVDGADETSFSTDWLCDRAADFINQHADEPFCYFVSLPDPHGPNTVRAPYDTMFDDIEVPIPASLKRTAAQIPAWGKPSGVTEKQIRKLMGNYYGMVRCIDDNVGKLLAVLEARGILDQTVIVFTSDHGDLCGEHGRLNKGVPYEGSARIPFLIRCPSEIPAGTVVKEALSCVDFFPTAMALLNQPSDVKVDGRNAAPLLKGQSVDWDDVTVIRSTPGKNAWLAAVTAQYKLVLCADGEPWLIDVKNDPNELTNLIASPEHQARIRRLAQHLQSYGTQHQDDHAQRPSVQAWLEELTTE